MATMDYSKASPFSGKEALYLDTFYGGSGIFENFSNANFRRFRSAMARMRAGTGVVRVGAYGDSNSNGYRASDGTGLYSRGFMERARSILNTENVFGPVGTGIIYPIIAGANRRIDQRFTLGAGWVDFNNPTQGLAVAGSIQGGPNTTAGSLDITLDNVNAFDVYIPAFNGGPTIVELWIDAEAKTTFNTKTAVGSEYLLKATVTTAVVGTHTLHVKVSSNDGTTYVEGLEGYNNTKPDLRVNSFGVSGGRAQSYNYSVNTQWHHTQLFTGTSGMVTPDLSFVNLSINDHNAATTEAVYKANMTTMLNQVKTFSDVILIASAPGGNGSVALWDDYLSWQRDLARDLGCGLINMQARWGAYSVASAAPHLLWGDADHPNEVGYWELGQAVAEAVKHVAGRSA